MDIDTRIRRRERRRDDERFVLDYQALDPVSHVDDPQGRGPVFERILDHLDPVFAEEIPADAALYGPRGAGKSAVVSALFDRLGSHISFSQSVIHTSTRVQTAAGPAFVYLDAREADSRSGLYHGTLSALREDTVPKQRVGTDERRSRLRSELASANGAVVAVDHVGEPKSPAAASVHEHFEAFGDLVSLFTVGRTPPEGAWCDTAIEVPGYGRQVLVDVLMTRASSGLTGNVLTHRQAQEIATWADGNAHDALAALFGAADAADRAGRERLTDEDIEGGMAAVPRPTVPLGRVLALPDNRQLLLRELVNLPETDRKSVTTTTEALAERPRVDLSTSTIRRVLYELAEDGIVERVRAEQTSGQGRPPSRVELRFPTLVFERLYDMRR